MSIARLQKEEKAHKLRDELADIPHAILVDFKGLNVEGATNLRRKLRDGDARFRVVKNSVVLRAVEDLPLAKVNEAFVGQTAIAYTEGDVVNLAKVLAEFAKEFETPSFKAGIVDGAPISAEEFEQLAKLPPRDQLIAKALYLMNYPITGLATALSGILKGFVVVLDQIRQQKEEAGEAEPVAEAEAAVAAAAPADEASAEVGEDAAAEEATAAEASEEAPAEAAAAEVSEEAPAGETAAAEAGEETAEEAAASDEASEDAPAQEATADSGEQASEEESSEEAGSDEAGEEEEKS